MKTNLTMAERNARAWVAAARQPDGQWTIYETQEEIPDSLKQTPAQIAADAAKAAQEEADAAAALGVFIGMTPAQVELWDVVNVSSMPQVRVALITLAKAVAQIARRSSR